MGGNCPTGVFLMEGNFDGGVILMGGNCPRGGILTGGNFVGGFF